MPKYIEDYEYSDNEEDDDEIIIVPYVKPPPPMIVLEDDDEPVDHTIPVGDNTSRSVSEKCSPPQRGNSENARGEQNVSNRSAETSKSQDCDSNLAPDKTSKKSRRGKKSEDYGQDKTLYDEGVRPSNDETSTISTNYIVLCDDVSGTASESGQNVEPGVSIISNHDNIGIDNITRSSGIVTNSNSTLTTGNNQNNGVAIGSDDFEQLIHIASGIFESGQTATMDSSNTNVEIGQTQGNAQPSNLSPACSVVESLAGPMQGKKRTPSRADSPRKRISGKSAREQSRSDLLKFIQHLGLPLHDLPAMDAPTRKRKAKISQVTAATTTTSDLQPPPTTRLGASQAFVSTTKEVSQSGNSKPLRKKSRTTGSLELPISTEENAFSLSELESISSDIQTNATINSFLAPQKSKPKPKDAVGRRSEKKCGTPKAKDGKSEDRKRKNKTNECQNNIQKNCSSEKNGKSLCKKAPKLKGNQALNLRPPKYTKATGNRHVHPQQTFPRKWNQGMIDFYGTMKDENLEISDIHDFQPNSQSKWRAPEDTKRKNRRNERTVRCTFCHEFGHTRYACTERAKPKICFMCGGQGHSADGKDSTSCPNALCLNCGGKQGRFQSACHRCLYRKPQPTKCVVCHVEGHTKHTCPDNWRKYHSTTGDPSKTQQVEELNKKRDILDGIRCKSDAMSRELEDAVRNTKTIKLGEVPDWEDGGYKKKLDLVEAAEQKELKLTFELKRLQSSWERELQLFHQLKTLLDGTETTAERQERHTYKPGFSIYCSNCGVQGHNYFHCKVPRYKSFYQPNKPFVIRELPAPIVSDYVITESFRQEVSRQPGGTSAPRTVTFDGGSLKCPETIEIRIDNPPIAEKVDDRRPNSMPDGNSMNSENTADAGVGTRKLTLNRAEYDLLSSAIEKNMANELIRNNQSNNIGMKFLAEDLEVHLVGSEQGLDQARLDIFKLLLELKSSDPNMPTKIQGVPNKTWNGKPCTVTSRDMEQDLASISGTGSGCPDSGVTGHAPEMYSKTNPASENPFFPRVPNVRAYCPETLSDNRPGSNSFHTRAEASFQEDELTTMFDIDERKLTEQGRLFAAMSMFQPNGPFSLDVPPLPKYIPIPIPVPVEDYRSFASGSAVGGVGPFNFQASGQLAKAYYQSSANFPQLPQILPTEFPNSPAINPIGTKPKEHSIEKEVPPPARDESPEVEIIDELPSQAVPSQSDKSKEPRKLNNIKEHLTISLSPAEWDLFRNDKTEVLLSISRVLNSNLVISLSKRDMMVTIKGGNRKARGQAHQGVLDFMKAKADKRDFTFTCPDSTPDSASANRGKHQSDNVQSSSSNGMSRSRNLDEGTVQTETSHSSRHESNSPEKRRPHHSRNMNDNQHGRFTGHKDHDHNNFLRGFPRDEEPEYRPRRPYLHYNNQPRRQPHFQRDYNPYYAPSSNYRGRGRGGGRRYYQ